MSRIILASKSPRRKELLKKIVDDFLIVEANVDESIDINKDIISEINRLSYIKAKSVFDLHNDAIVIGSDTVVVSNDNIVLTKPKDKFDAFNMIYKLQSNMHKVITSTTIISKKKSVTFSNVSKVYFSKMDKDEIDSYISTNAWISKAGAYGIQDEACKYIEKIDGDFYSIMGLSINQIYKELKDFI